MPISHPHRNAPAQASQTDVQEWAVVRRAVDESIDAHKDAWAALVRCHALEAYTDGSAPVRNPGGPVGFAAVIVGFHGTLDISAHERPEPSAQLDLGGYVAARKTEPKTSNNRAEIAGILAAMLALRHLLGAGWQGSKPTVWSDSQYAVYCATGKWKRNKNLDLWAEYDRLSTEVRGLLPQGFALEWVKGHAGNRFNEAADDLATRAAFNFDAQNYARYRAAQLTTGREMPGREDAPAPKTAIATSSAPRNWLAGADYVLVLDTRLDVSGQANAGYGRATGNYRVWAKDGRTRRAAVDHPGLPTHDEAEYLTLVAALSDMLSHMAKGASNPAKCVLRVYSNREIVVKQLAGVYRVRSEGLQHAYQEANRLLAKFARAEAVFKPRREIDELMREPPVI